VHHGKRLAVTAGATVLGLAAMTGVGHADTGGTGSGSPLADLTDSLTGVVGGLTGTLTGSGGSSPGSGTSGGSGSTSSTGSSDSGGSSPSGSGPATSIVKPRAVRDAVTSATGTGGSGTSGSARTPSTSVKKSGKAREKPVHLDLKATPELDLKKLTAAGGLHADVGLKTLLGTVGLKVDADGRLSAEDIAILDPVGSGNLDVGANVLGLEAGANASGNAVVRPGEIGVGADIGGCVGSCAPSPPPAPPAPPAPPGGGGGGGGGGGEPPATPPLPPIPELPAVPGLPPIPIGGTSGQEPVTAGGDAAPPPRDLPITGVDSLSLIAVGLATAVIGGFAVASTRRRDPEPA
jgi:hypothetical protein